VALLPARRRDRDTGLAVDPAVWYAARAIEHDAQIINEITI
jgi:hypothetical protein